MQGKIVIVTGSAQGIGLSIAKKFSDSGATVILNDLNEKCILVAEELSKNGSKCIGITCDISKSNNVDTLFDIVIEKFGQVDILVNNAGITSDTRLHKMTEKQWDSVMNVNLKSMFLTCKRAVSLMSENGGGAIINISSISAQIGNMGQSNYNASKMGIIGLTRTICTEYASKGIRANAVAPGFIGTNIIQSIPAKTVEKIIDSIPMKRAGKPQEVANIVYFLASEEASFINGQLLSVNGGQYMY